MAGNENHRETGARKYPAASGPEPQDEFSQDAAGNRPPPSGVGLTQPLEETGEDTRQSESVNPPRRPNAPRSGRQSGASVKDR